MGAIREGQKVKLSFNMSDGSEKEFDCFIRSVYSDRLALAFPKDLLNYMEYLEEGSDISAKVFTPLGVKVFDSIVLDSPLEPEFVIEYAEVSTEIQRREYVRVQLKAKVVLERANKTSVVAYTIDISGGGLKFFYEGEFVSHESLGITLYLPDARSVQARGVIVPNEYIPQNEHVLSFTEIEERERDRVIKQCFDLQLAKD